MDRKVYFDQYGRYGPSVEQRRLNATGLRQRDVVRSVRTVRVQYDNICDPIVELRRRDALIRNALSDASDDAMKCTDGTSDQEWLTRTISAYFDVVHGGKRTILVCTNDNVCGAYLDETDKTLYVVEFIAFTTIVGIIRTNSRRSTSCKRNIVLFVVVRYAN